MSRHNNPSAGPVADAPIDLEEYAQAGKPPPKGKEYRIRVDEQQFVVSSPITGRQILDLVGADPATHYVTVRIRGGHPPVREVGLDEQVDLATPGLERFFVRSRQSQPG